MPDQHALLLLDVPTSEQVLDRSDSAATRRTYNWTAGRQSQFRTPCLGSESSPTVYPESNKLRRSIADPDLKRQLRDRGSQCLADNECADQIVVAAILDCDPMSPLSLNVTSIWTPSTVRSFLGKAAPNYRPLMPS